MCNYSPTNRAPKSKKGPKGILIQDPIRASYDSVTYYRNNSKVQDNSPNWQSGFPMCHNWANLKSATQIAELFDNYEDVRKVNSEPMDRLGRNDKILTYSGIKEKENRFGKTSPRLGASVPESTRERIFEKRVIQRCYHCNMPGHIKAVCPKLIRRYGNLIRRSKRNNGGN
ncbi:hypothetical protein TNCV_4712281 [Trichonephila clavipes]|nr:hypothetical protein TNCV_4712281 [Trichonephila clavipes]